MNIVRTIFLALGAVFALVLIGVGIFGYLVTGPAPTYDGAEVEVSHEATASLDLKIEAFRQDIDEASAGDMVGLLITEEEATSKLHDLAQNGELPTEMNYIQIHFDDGTLYGSAIVDLIIDIQVAVQAEIGVNDQGKPDITIKSFNFGRLIIPTTLVGNVMLALMKEMEERLESLPFELQEITIENGEISITARVKESL